MLLACWLASKGALVGQSSSKYKMCMVLLTTSYNHMALVKMDPVCHLAVFVFASKGCYLWGAYRPGN
eukprot:1144132-Pelagomonas_calceolata.AAC.1